MKNILTILLASFILVSGMHLSIDRHICGGKVADVIISFSEKGASCAMDNDMATCSTHQKATSDCCRNEATRLAVDDYFASSSFQVKEVTQPVFQLFFLPVIQSLYSLNADIQAYSDVSPPDNLIANEVCLPKICVFRI